VHYHASEVTRGLRATNDRSWLSAAVEFLENLEEQARIHLTRIHISDTRSASTFRNVHTWHSREAVTLVWKYSLIIGHVQVVTDCGYAAVKNVGTMELYDNMPSFFLR
jgi:hypothetical protein